MQSLFSCFSICSDQPNANDLFLRPRLANRRVKYISQKQFWTSWLGLADLADPAETVSAAEGQTLPNKRARGQDDGR